MATSSSNLLLPPPFSESSRRWEPLRRVAYLCRATFERVWFAGHLRAPVVIQDDDDVYSSLYFSSITDISTLIARISQLGGTAYSQWYGRLETIPTINFDLRVHDLPRSDRPFRYAAVLPCSLDYDARCVITVREELLYSLLDLRDVVSSKPAWFPAPPQLSKARRKDKEKDKDNDVEEGNTDDNAFVPVVFLSLRLVELADEKVRSFGVQHLIENALAAAYASCPFGQPARVTLVMRDNEVRQTGLYTLVGRPGSSYEVWNDSTNQIPVARLTVPVPALQAYVDHVLCAIDGVVLDVLIHLNESVLLPDRGERLDLSAVPHAVHATRCIDPARLRDAIRSADTAESPLDDSEVYKAVKYVMFLVNDYGYSLEVPLKIINESLSTFHVYQQCFCVPPGEFDDDESSYAIFKSIASKAHSASNSSSAFLHPPPTTDFDELDADTREARRVSVAGSAKLELRQVKGNTGSTTKTGGGSDTVGDTNKSTSRSPPDDTYMRRLRVFQPYVRKVRSVSTTGYRVKVFSAWIWVTLAVGLALPIVYIFLRIDRASFEDVISTATAIIGLYIAVLSPVVLQLFYKGEQLIDVLRNVREVDRQEEFAERAHAHLQTPDILQVLRVAKRSPDFLGGSNNTSYVANRRPANGFDARDPLNWANLHAVGFGLFETDAGDLFVIDPWSNLFEAVVLDATRQVALNRHRPRSNTYAPARPDEAVASLSLYCKVVDLVTPIEKWKQPHSPLNQSPTASTGAVGTDEVLALPHRDTGCFVARYNGLEDVKSVMLSRVLPFGARMRQVGMAKERSIRAENAWRRINNKDLLRMDVGLKKPLFEATPMHMY